MVEYSFKMFLYYQAPTTTTKKKTFQTNVWRTVFCSVAVIKKRKPSTVWLAQNIQDLVIFSPHIEHIPCSQSSSVKCIAPARSVAGQLSPASQAEALRAKIKQEETMWYWWQGGPQTPREPVLKAVPLWK